MLSWMDTTNQLELANFMLNNYSNLKKKPSLPKRTIPLDSFPAKFSSTGKIIEKILTRPFIKRENHDSCYHLTNWTRGAQNGCPVQIRLCF